MQPKRTPSARAPKIDINDLEPEALFKMVEAAGGQREFSRLYDVPRSSLQNRLKLREVNLFGHRPPPQPRIENVTGGVRRFILSAAQDATDLHDDFLTALEAYRDYLTKDGPCDIYISGFTYNKRLFENHDPDKEPYWDERIMPYLVHDRIRLGEQIDFCGEMNTVPTAKTPLAGFETYTRSRWGILPHAKVQLRSIATMKNSPAKIIMTTGAVTKTNYVHKRAGIEASFHHALGAVLVEIDADGTFFARHLLGEADGSFYDLDRRVQIIRTRDDAGRRVTKSEITEGNRIKAINWGDLHVAQIDPDVADVSFGYRPDADNGRGRTWTFTREDSILDTLKPEYQFFHDVADFQSRNHHNLRDPHHMFELFVAGVDSVENELREVATFIECTRRDFCETVVVESNHDLALKKWLKEADYRQDPLNARFFLRCQDATYESIEQRNHGFSIFEHVLTRHFPDRRCAGVRFLREDESFVVLDIEKGMHGHLGANGARGSPIAYTKMGPKSTTGHTHSCEIRDGSYVSGTTSKLDMGYNRGLSSWSHSHVATLPNGKRQIITLQNGKWRL